MHFNEDEPFYLSIYRMIEIWYEMCGKRNVMLRRLLDGDLMYGIHYIGVTTVISVLLANVADTWVNQPANTAPWPARVWHDNTTHYHHKIINFPLTAILTPVKRCQSEWWVVLALQPGSDQEESSYNVQHHPIICININCTNILTQRI